MCGADDAPGYKYRQVIGTEGGMDNGRDDDR